MIRPDKYLSTSLSLLVNKLLTAAKPFYPRPPCMFCEGIITSGEVACTHCIADLEWNTCCCYRCGEPFSQQLKPSDPFTQCPACMKKPGAIHRTVAPLRYAFPVNSCLHELKYRGKRFQAKRLTTLTAPHFAAAYQYDTLPDYLVPVPSHINDLRHRGYNQALLLAKKLSGKVSIAVEAQLLTKRMQTSSQTLFDKAARQRNLKHAFAWQAQEPFEAQHVAIVDDVMTTGATMNAIAQLLQAQGIERVDAWCIARTPKQHAR